MQKVDRRGVSPEDDGDYAKLRELPMVTRATTDHSDDNTSEDTKVRTSIVHRLFTSKGYALSNNRYKRNNRIQMTFRDENKK